MPQQSRAGLQNQAPGRSCAARACGSHEAPATSKSPAQRLPRTTPISAICDRVQEPEDHHAHHSIERQDAVINEPHLAPAEAMGTGAGRPDHVGPAPGNLVAHADLARSENQEAAAQAS